MEKKDELEHSSHILANVANGQQQAPGVGNGLSLNTTDPLAAQSQSNNLLGVQSTSNNLSFPCNSSLTTIEISESQPHQNENSRQSRGNLSKHSSNKLRTCTPSAVVVCSLNTEGAASAQNSDNISSCRIGTTSMLFNGGIDKQEAHGDTPDTSHLPNDKSVYAVKEISVASNAEHIPTNEISVASNVEHMPTNEISVASNVEHVPINEVILTGRDVRSISAVPADTSANAKEQGKVATTNREVMPRQLQYTGSLEIYVNRGGNRVQVQTTDVTDLTNVLNAFNVPFTEGPANVQPMRPPDVTQVSCQEHIQTKVIRSSNSSLGACRICYEGSSKEALISPCKCTGTMGSMHRSCIERWLGSSNSNKCEICDFEYITVRIPKPFTEWLCVPGRHADRRNLLGDIVCFFLLTPLAGVSTWLCGSGAIKYSRYEHGRWEAIGLLTLSIFLVTIYLVWCSVAVRYHYGVFIEWSEHNQHVRVLGLDQLTDVRHQSTSRAVAQNVHSLQSITVTERQIEQSQALTMESQNPQRFRSVDEL